MDAKVKTIGSMIDELTGIRDKRRDLAKKDEELAAQYTALEKTIIERLATEGTDKASSKKATASLSQVTVANITDWDAFHQFVKKTGYFHLLQRRVSDPAFREVVELAKTDKKLAKLYAECGGEPFVKTKLNLRNI